MRHFRIFVIVAIALAATTINPAGAQSGKVWKHGLLNAKADAGFFYMAAKRGFADKLGLKLELLQIKDDQVGLKALIAGELDSFEGGPQGVIAADSKGADARIIGCHWLVVPHGIYVREGISKVEELKGKSIAVSAPNSMPDMLARAALERYGVSPADVKLAAVGGDRERYQALVGGVVEAAVVSNEYEPIAPKSVRLLVAGRDAVPNFLRVCLASTARVLAARGDDAVRFLAAEMQALRYAIGHKDETVALTRELANIKPDDPRPGFVFDDAVEHKAVAPDLPIPLEKLGWLQDQMVQAGKLVKPLDLKTIVAPEFRAKALAQVGH